MNNDIEYLENRPFRNLIMSIGVLPSSYVASMSYQELLYWLCNYLEETVIPAVNNNGQAVEELQTAYTTLHDYVMNYFSNLDVQEEINNKLDQMAEDGSLTLLIKNYVDPIYQAYEQSIHDYLVAESEANLNFKLTLNDQMESLSDRVNLATSGAPKGVYATVSALTTADPDHDYIYLVTADGKWYYYDINDGWTAGGTYQSTGIADKEITYNKTDFLKLGNQLFNRETVTTGKYIDYTDGVMKTNASSAASDYIIVDGLEKVISNYNNQCAFYDVNKTFISGYNDYGANVPATAYYMRVTVPNSEDTFKRYMLNEGETVLSYEPYSYINKYLKINSSKINYDTKINEVDTQFVTRSRQLLDFNNITEGKYVVYNTGNILTNVSYFVTDYIIVKGEEYLTIEPYTSGYQLAFYTEDKSYISGNINSETISIPSNAYYIRFSAPLSYVDKQMVYFGSTTGLLYEPYRTYLYKDLNKVIYVGPHRDITSLKEGIETATKYFGATLYVDEGVYDLVSEYTQSYLDNLTTGDKGLVLKNQVHIIFASNAYVTFNYTGENEYIHKYFSPFNSGMYGFTIENLTLTASNCRYCVHDERGGSTEFYINKYINCDMSLDNSQNPDWTNPQNIGAGLGEQGYIIVDGCHFNNWCTWHNNNNTGYLNSRSKVVIKNNYFDEGFIYATDDTLTAFTNASEFYVYNNCKKGNIVTTAGNTNIVVKEWNNVQHD